MVVARTNLMVVAWTKIKCSYRPNPAYFDFATISQWTRPCSLRNELFKLLWLAARFKKLVDYGRTWVTTIRHKRCFQKQTNLKSVFLLGILHTSCSPLSRKAMKKNSENDLIFVHFGQKSGTTFCHGHVYFEGMEPLQLQSKEHSF